VSRAFLWMSIRSVLGNWIARHNQLLRFRSNGQRLERSQLAHPFLILILEGAPLLSRLLRQGGDFDLHELRMPSQVPRLVPAKNAGTRTGQPLELRFYSETEIRYRRNVPVTSLNRSVPQVPARFLGGNLGAASVSADPG
jgi:hypothetical protein